MGRTFASMRPRVFPAEDSAGRVAADGSRGASMRPRVFPAEDRATGHATASTCGRFNEAAGIPRGRLGDVNRITGDIRASMRPRVFPAEDGRALPVVPRAVPASMRPRVFPAEDRARTASPGPRSSNASMRPRVFPAEDEALYGDFSPPHVRFNEAAGIPRGRLRHGGARDGAQYASMRPRVFPAEDTLANDATKAVSIASMRPRVFPAEDTRPRPRPRRPPPRFNEAAGIPRGRPRDRLAARRNLQPGFNEAAGIPRGRLPNVRVSCGDLGRLQ